MGSFQCGLLVKLLILGQGSESPFCVKHSSLLAKVWKGNQPFFLRQVGLSLMFVRIALINWLTEMWKLTWYQMPKSVALRSVLTCHDLKSFWTDIPLLLLNSCFLEIVLYSHLSQLCLFSQLSVPSIEVLGQIIGQSFYNGSVAKWIRESPSCR